MRRKGVSQSDVARLAGVSATAVSLVLNGKQSSHRIAPDTVRRIHSAIAELRYRPNAVARTLVQGRAHTIGVVLGEANMAYLTNPYYGPALQGIVGFAFSRRQFVVLYHGGELTESEMDATVYVDGRCDGLILTPPFTDDTITAPLRDMRFPFVTLGDLRATPGIPGVDVDNESAGREAAAYLLSQGHRNILALGSTRFSHSARRRLTGCRHEVELKGGLCCEAMIRGREDSDVLETLTEMLFRVKQGRPTAIFCLTDEIALQVIRVLRGQGQEVPRDVSVMGFDDVPEAADAGLTTIRQDPLAVGEQATRLLLRLIDNPAECWFSEPTTITVPTQLVVRESAAPRRP